MKSEDTIHPFLTSFATPRTGSDEIVGRYCDQQHVWVVDGEEGPLPLILANQAVGRTSTSTKVGVEGDDTDVSSGLDYGTETYVKAEDDDIDRAALQASLGTSTRVLGEADDVDRTAAALLAVTTKTDANTERDGTAVGLEIFEPSIGGRIPPLPIQ